MDGEAAFGIIDETEVLASFLNADNVHEACWVCGIGADLAVNLDQALHDNGLGLASVKSILETISDEDDEGHAVTELVRTGRWAGGIGAGQFVQKPMRWRAQALLVLLWSSTHGCVSRDLEMQWLACWKLFLQARLCP